MTLLDAIPLGRQHALKKRELAARLGITTRDFEHEIEELRKGGTAAICSDSLVGYWRPLTVAELADNIERRHKRALSQLATVSGEQRALLAWQANEAVPLAFQWAEA